MRWLLLSLLLALDTANAAFDRNVVVGRWAVYASNLLAGPDYYFLHFNPDFSGILYEMMESYWPAVARGDEEAPAALREWAVKLEEKPKYVMSSTRKNFPWINSHHIAGDLGTGVQKLKDATPAGVLLGSGRLATELDRLNLIDEYKFLVHPRIAGHGPTLYQSGLPGTRRLELVSAQPLRSGAVAMHYRRARG